MAKVLVRLFPNSEIPQGSGPCGRERESTFSLCSFFSAKVTAERQSFPRFFWRGPLCRRISLMYVGSRKWFSQLPAVTCTPEMATVVVCLLIGGVQSYTRFTQPGTQASEL
jgi:hypothetical protein